MTNLQQRSVNDRIMVQEVFENGRYLYKAPTHWSDGPCYLTEYANLMDDNAPSEWRLGWGSGGIQDGYSYQEIADVMATAFSMASHRLTLLSKGE